MDTKCRKVIKSELVVPVYKPTKFVSGTSVYIHMYVIYS